MNFIEDFEQTLLSLKAALSVQNNEANFIVNSLLEKLNSYKDEKTETTTPFTKRELDIFTLIAKGFTNKEVASAFSISPKTVEFHLKNVYEKCQASGRSEAITIAISKGWIIP